ncbi:hypothetical protein [Thomasclavelia spiroformis]|uniref:hypothetical protein n=2 Tax=Thomasclavelia spiroformis TaxID=29348 RepID=UPI00241DFBF0|nr:hypothetical protein [Thomasclavelia spiroformis]MBS6685316.1 hypothetical protein [Thomasclavelia spiroformis]
MVAMRSGFSVIVVSPKACFIVIGNCVDVFVFLFSYSLVDDDEQAVVINKKPVTTTAKNFFI